MKRIFALAGAGLTALALLTQAKPVEAQAPIEMNIGSLAPKGTPWMTMLEKMEKQIETETNGSINVILRPPGVMSEVEMVRETRKGERLQGAGVTTAAIAEGGNVAQMQIVELPYLFKNSAEADYVLDEVIWDDMKSALYRRGFVLAIWSENGWRSMATKGKEIRKPDDLKGVKMRSQESAVHLEMYKTFGAQAVQKPMTEVLTSINSGIVDGLDQPPLYLVAGGLAEPLDHYTLTRHIYQPATIIVSRKFYDELSADQKKAIDGVKVLAQEGREGVRTEQAALLDLLREQLNVIDLSAEELAVWETKAKTMHDPFVSTIDGGPELLSKINTALAAKRAQ